MAPDAIVRDYCIQNGIVSPANFSYADWQLDKEYLSTYRRKVHKFAQYYQEYFEEANQLRRKHLPFHQYRLKYMKEKVAELKWDCMCTLLLIKQFISQTEERYSRLVANNDFEEAEKYYKFDTFKNARFYPIGEIEDQIEEILYADDFSESKKRWKKLISHRIELAVIDDMWGFWDFQQRTKVLWKGLDE